jgi:hypothetical protein
MHMKPVRIGLLGLGTVGGGTVQVLARNATRSRGVPGAASPWSPRRCATCPAADLRPTASA